MTIPTETELIKQDVERLAHRIDDLALAFAKMRAEVDANTEAVSDHHLWIVHGREGRKIERAPELRPKNLFES